MSNLVEQSTSDDMLELQRQIARQQALLEASRQVHGTIVLSEVLMTALKIAVRELEVSGASFTRPQLQYGEMPAEPWDTCARFALPENDGAEVGELVIACDRQLTMSEEDFLEGLVLQTAVAVKNAQYHERDIEWARVQQDLNAARQIQRSLLPAQMPDVPGYDVAFRNTTCFEVGGDYVDLIEVEDQQQIMIVADVAGKGLASAIVGTAFRSAFRALASSGLPLATVAQRLNQQHWQEGEETRRKYVTAFLLRLDYASGRLEFVNAGHNPAFLLPANADAAILLKASGPPLGMLPGREYEAEVHDFPPSSRLMVYTDGLTEVFKDDEEFGEDRLLESFQHLAGQDSPATLAHLWKTIHEFSGGEPQGDDMTALVISRSYDPRSAGTAAPRAVAEVSPL